jgi:probable rRNA maturation factor
MPAARAHVDQLVSVTVENRGRLAAHPERRVARAAGRALAALGRAGEHVDVMLVDDRAIRVLNARYRGVRRRTDVLAFPMDSPLVGQVVVSVETAQRQARRLGVPFELELDLLVTHGVLHLGGYDDRDPVEARLMHEREREILSSTGAPLPDRLWTGLLHG